LAENLRKYNKKLDDNVFVYFAEDNESDKFLAQQAQSLIHSETKSPILRVSDPEVAKQLKLKSGSYYCYYKPSYINGFGQS